MSLRWILAVAVLALSISVQALRKPNALTRPEIQTDRLLLYADETTFGWANPVFASQNPAVWSVADGSLQVNKRLVDETNARKGARKAPGIISLQGHAPTTDLSFRSIHIMEMPKN